MSSPTTHCHENLLRHLFTPCWPTTQLKLSLLLAWNALCLAGVETWWQSKEACSVLTNRCNRWHSDPSGEIRISWKCSTFGAIAFVTCSNYRICICSLALSFQQIPRRATKAYHKIEFVWTWLLYNNINTLYQTTGLWLLISPLLPASREDLSDRSRYFHGSGWPKLLWRYFSVCL